MTNAPSRAATDSLTVRAALSAVGLTERPGTEICLFIDDGKTKRNVPLAEYAEMHPAEVPGNLYVASGLFKEGSIKNGVGRFWGNLDRIVWLVFDMDLHVDGLSRSDVYELPRAELDVHLADLKRRAERAFAECDIAIHRLDTTGHGLCAYLMVHPDHQRNLLDVKTYHQSLIAKINAHVGYDLIDRQCSDSGTRVTRVPGALNVKGSTPKPVNTLYCYPGQTIRIPHTDGPAPTDVAPMDLPDVGPAIARSDAEHLIAAIAPFWIEGQKHHMAVAVAGAFAHAGLPENEARALVRTLASNDRDPRDRVKAVTDTYERARNGTAISGLPGLAEYLPDDVVDRIGRTLRPYREKLTLPRATTKPDTPEPHVPSFMDHVYTAAQLLEMTPERPNWLVERFIARGAITEIDAPPKVGKTTFLGYLVRCIATGSDCFETPVEQGAVLYLTEQTKTTFREIITRTGIGALDNVHVVSWHDVRADTWAQTVENAIEAATQLGVKLIVIDTLPQWAGLIGDAENNAGDALSAMAPLQVAAGLDLAVVIVRHDRKGGGEVGMSARGSTAFAGVVDIIIALRRLAGEGKPNMRKLSAVGRFDESNIAELVIELQENGSYQTLEREEAFAMAHVRQLLLDVMARTSSGACSIDDLAKEIDAPRPTVKKIITDWEKGGIASKVGLGKRGDPYCYYIVNEPEYVAEMAATSPQTPAATVYVDLASPVDGESDNPFDEDPE